MHGSTLDINTWIASDNSTQLHVTDLNRGPISPTVSAVNSTTESEITTTEKPVIAMNLTLKHDPQFEDRYHVVQYTVEIPGLFENQIPQRPGKEAQESYKLVPSMGDDSSMSIDRTQVSLLGIGNLELKNGTTTETGQLTGFYKVYKIEENPARNEKQYYFGREPDH